MRKILLAFFCVAYFSTSYAQNNSEIANVYIKRANAVIEESIDFKEALVLFEKAMKYTDSVTKPKVANLGSRIYFELMNYKEYQELRNEHGKKKGEKIFCDLYLDGNKTLGMLLD